MDAKGCEKVADIRSGRIRPLDGARQYLAIARSRTSRLVAFVNNSASPTHDIDACSAVNRTQTTINDATPFSASEEERPGLESLAVCRNGFQRLNACYAARRGSLGQSVIIVGVNGKGEKRKVRLRLAIRASSLSETLPGPLARES